MKTRLALALALACAAAFAQVTTVPSTGAQGQPGAPATLGDFLAPAYTTSQTSASTWCGKLVPFNGTTLTVTLKSPPVDACPFAVVNLNATVLAISRNGLTFNGAAANPTSLAGISGADASGQAIWTDGTNYAGYKMTTGTAGTNGAPGADLTTTNVAGASFILDTFTNYAQIKNGPQAPAFATTTDQLCAATAGTPACADTPAAIGTTETPFSHRLALPVNVPATNRAVLWYLGFDYASQAGPTIQWRMKACLTANYTAATGACSAGGVVLFLSNAATITSTNSQTSQSGYIFLIQSGGSGNLQTTMISQTGGATKSAQLAAAGGNSPTQTTSVPMTTGPYTIYLTITWSAATASNWVGLTQSATEYLY